MSVSPHTFSPSWGRLQGEPGEGEGKLPEGWVAACGGGVSFLLAESWPSLGRVLGCNKYHCPGSSFLQGVFTQCIPVARGAAGGEDGRTVFVSQVWVSLVI